MYLINNNISSCFICCCFCSAVFFPFSDSHMKPQNASIDHRARIETKKKTQSSTLVVIVVARIRKKNTSNRNKMKKKCTHTQLVAICLLPSIPSYGEWKKNMNLIVCNYLLNVWFTIVKLQSTFFALQRAVLGLCAFHSRASAIL